MIINYITKEQCDYLTVGISTDELVLKNKTPIIPFKDRCEIVNAIRYVDEVIPQINKDKLSAYHRLQKKINKIFVGGDWKGTPQWKEYEKQFTPLGVEIIYFPHTDGISSTILREKL